MNLTYDKAREFIYRNARPLDLARWKYHFEKGSKDDVLDALLFYQNSDGGFGHALEADSWNPISSPIQTWVATEILHEIDFTDQLHPIVKGILQYLDSGKDFNGKFWYNKVKSNNDYPHASWWSTDNDTTANDNYNPTACLAGFIIRFADKDSDLYKIGCRIAKESFHQLFFSQRENDMHTIACYIRMMNYIEESKENDIIDLPLLKKKLDEQIKKHISTEVNNWETSYICKPSQFFNTKKSCFYMHNQKIADYECEYIIKTQCEDGSWNIPWSWNDYLEQWAISKNWWKCNVIILNILYLKGFERL